MALVSPLLSASREIPRRRAGPGSQQGLAAKPPPGHVERPPTPMDCDRQAEPGSTHGRRQFRLAAMHIPASQHAGSSPLSASCPGPAPSRTRCWALTCARAAGARPPSATAARPPSLRHRCKPSDVSDRWTFRTHRPRYCRPLFPQLRLVVKRRGRAQLCCGQEWHDSRPQPALRHFPVIICWCSCDEGTSRVWAAQAYSLHLTAASQHELPPRT